MATAPPATAGPPAITPLIVFPRSLTWEELFATADWVSTSPAVPYYGVLSAAIFNSADPPETFIAQQAGADSSGVPHGGCIAQQTGADSSGVPHGGCPGL